MNRSRRLPTLARWMLSFAFAAILLAPSARPASAQTTEALIDTVQHTGVLYFWEQANPANGLVKDRSTAGSPASIAAVGFGLSALCIGVDHGWLTRAQVRSRVLTTLNTFWTGPQSSAATGTIGYKGLYYHFLDMNTATRTWDSELSTIDTALLFAGILDAKQYFNGSDPEEVMIRQLADSIYYRADWNFARNFNQGIMMGWKPGTGFNGFGQWVGYNEAMILYVLALGSPTHPVPTISWSKWTSNYSWQTWYGQSFLICPPLFTHQYSHCWIDFSGMQDNYMRAQNSNYAENSRRATIAQHAYCIANPGAWTAYSDSLWGLTASDDPFGYSAHGAPPAQSDNGTITPTAGLSSIVFTPELSIPLLHNLWNNWRGSLWGAYGFVDAFNPYYGWVDSDYLGIDQGPIVLMMENYRNGSVWARTYQNLDLRTGLARASFTGSNTGVEPVPFAGVALSGVSPNPLSGTGTVRFRLAEAGRARLDVYDLRGRHVRSLLDAERAAGDQSVLLPAGDLAAGVYYVRLEAGGSAATARFVRVHRAP
ncbi:MAG: glucoamylase family protein [Candidatus Eisenbacteria bacterium]